MIKRLINIIPPYPELVVLLLTVVLVTSCHTEKEMPKPNKLVPDKALVSILSEVTIADGLLTLSIIKEQFLNEDSLHVYSKIIERYGYSREELDNTIRYYYVKRKSKLIKIYDEVLAVLSELETKAQKEAVEAIADESDKWTGDRLYSFPDLTKTGDGDFSIRVEPPGYYDLTFTVTLYSCDFSKDAGFTGWYINADSVETGRRTYLRPEVYIRDGQPHIITISGRIETASPVLFQGKLYSSGNEPDHMARSARIEIIRFNFTNQAL